MPIPFLTKSRNPVAERCRDDYPTSMRLKYAPFYHAMDWQKGTRVRLDGREMVMLASNDYLGLSFHPRVIEAGQKALEIWGTSTTGARPSNGSRAYHHALEEKLAAFLDREACHISVAGYISCMSGIAAFAQKGDVVLVDKNIHSCIWDGIRLTLATIERFSHNNPQDLRELAETLDPAAPKILVLEGVYSMEGHIASLPDLIGVAEEHQCFTVVDDAHGLGVLGRQGRGTVDHFGLNDKVDLIVGSLSKSLASTGGFVAGSKDLIEYLRTHSRQTIFSASISPGQAACAEAALDIIQTEPEHLENLWKNTRRYTELLKSLGLNTWDTETPAVPVVLGTKELAYRFWKLLMEKGVFTVMSIAPAVPPGKDLIRTAVSAMHSDEDMEIIAEAFDYAVKKI